MGCPFVCPPLAGKPGCTEHVICSARLGLCHIGPWAVGQQSLVILGLITRKAHLPHDLQRSLTSKKYVGPTAYSSVAS